MELFWFNFMQKICHYTFIYKIVILILTASCKSLFWSYKQEFGMNKIKGFGEPTKQVLGVTSEIK